MPVTSVQQLIDYGRKNAAKLQFPSSGNGSSMLLSGELFKRMTGIQMLHVPYKAAQQGIMDPIAGQMHLKFDNMSSIGVHVKGGRVWGLAVTSLQRSSSYPDLPTMDESGVPRFEVVPFGGIVAPVGLSPALLQFLNAQLNKALASPSLREKFAQLGSEPTGGTPEQFAALVKREAAKWGDVIRDANIRPD